AAPCTACSPWTDRRCRRSPARARRRRRSRSRRVTGCASPPGQGTTGLQYPEELFDGGVAPGALAPAAGAAPPGTGADIVGLDGATAVPRGEDSPGAPVETGGPTGTLGAPGSDSVGEFASGD